MRALALALVCVVLAAGCVADAPSPAPPGPTSPSTPGGDTTGPRADVADEPTFCEAEEGCTFWDDDYHEYVLYDVDTPELDVIIVPSASADTADDTPVIKAAVDAWSAGAKSLGAPWFASGFVMRVYVAGTDEIPQEARDDPEILVLAAEYNPVLLFGIGLEPKQQGVSCESFGERTLRHQATHAHDGMRIAAADCTGLGFLCVAANTNFLLGDAIYLQDLVAHEVGHCLGGGHVGDAMDFSAKRVPIHDIMSYQHNETQVHCVSNLNVRVLEGLYAPLIEGSADAPVLSAGDTLAMAPALYRQVDCP